MVSHTFPPLGTVGGSIRLLTFLKYLNYGKDGWEPSVLTVNDDQDLLFLNKGSKFALKAIPEQVRILRASTSEFKVPSAVFGKMRSVLRKIKVILLKPIENHLLIPDSRILWKKGLFRVAKAELSKKNFSIIYATAPPFSVLFMAAKISKKFQVPLVLDIKDDWVNQERYKKQLWFREAIERRMESYCVNHATKVIAVTEHSLSTYINRYPAHADKFVCVPNGVDLEEFDEIWKSPPPKKKKFTLVHSGVLGGHRDASALFRAISKLIKKHPEIKGNIQFITFGRVDRQLIQIAKDCEIDDVIQCCDFLERKPYIELLSSCHLPVAINVGVSPGTVPGKLYEYWASRNRQLLLENPDSAAAKLVSKYKIGNVVQAYDIDGIANVIYAAWLRYKNKEQDLVDVAGLSDFDRKKLTHQLEGIFSDVVNKNM